MVLYLDANASLPLRPEALAQVTAYCARQSGANPSSIHTLGQEQKRLIEDSRDIVRGALGVSEVVFTSGGTEANRLALSGAWQQRLIFACEHVSLLAGGNDHTVIPATPCGLCDLQWLEQTLAALGSDHGPTLVSVQAVNNETGVIQPLGEVARLCQEYSCVLHTDLSQALGKAPIAAWLEPSWAMATVSGHKIGALSGIGALVLRSQFLQGWPEPWLIGGGQESGLRSGTENTLGIITLGVMVANLPQLTAQWQQVRTVRDRLEQELLAYSGTRVLGTQAPRVANTSCVIHPSIDHETLLIRSDLAGFAIGAGSACSSGKTTVSHVLRAMGVDAPTARRAVRISLPPAVDLHALEPFFALWQQSL